MLARLAAVAFVAVALSATAIELTREEEEPAGWSAVRVENAPADQLRAELNRCQRLGEAGPRDAACPRAWAESRERFLAPGATRAQRPQLELTPQSLTQEAPTIRETAPQQDEAR